MENLTVDAKFSQELEQYLIQSGIMSTYEIAKLKIPTHTTNATSSTSSFVMNYLPPTDTIASERYRTHKMSVQPKSHSNSTITAMRNGTMNYQDMPYNTVNHQDNRYNSLVSPFYNDRYDDSSHLQYSEPHAIMYSRQRQQQRELRPQPPPSTRYQQYHDSHAYPSTLNSFSTIIPTSSVTNDIHFI
jgi:hypothetical protein